MAKKTILAIVLIFISWMVIDFFLHGIILSHLYESTAQLWRPSDQMNIPLIYIVTLILILCFVFIYILLINPKSLLSGIKYSYRSNNRYSIWFWHLPSYAHNSNTSNKLVFGWLV
jgi:hypothetical protein